MFDEDKQGCCCGEGQDDSHGCGDDCNCDNGNSLGDSVIVMTDTETGEEYTFVIADDFAYDDEHYCVLVTVGDEVEPEMIITRVVTLEDGSEGLMSLDEADYDRVYAEYERICEEDVDEDEDEAEV